MENLEISSINMVYNTQHSEIHDGPIKVLHEEPFIEYMIEEPPPIT